MIYENSILTPGQKLDIISKNLAEGVIIIDEEGNIEEWNDYMFNKTGYSRDEIIGKKIWDVQHNILPRELQRKYSLQRLQRIWMKFFLNLTENEFVRKQGQFISNDKRTLLTEDIICRIRLQTKNYLYVIQRARDLPGGLTNDKLLLSILSCQIKSLISGLSDLTDMFSEEQKRLHIDKLIGFVRKVMSSTENTINKLENLLIYTSVQMGVFEFNPVKTTLNRVLADIINDYEYPLDSKSIQMKFDQSSEIICTTDIYALKVILRNLLDHAVKNSCENGRIELNAKIKRKFVEISVVDNGAGIRKKTLKGLFSADLPHTNIVGEKGLGLFLSRILVEKQGGKLRVKSAVNKGSEYIFTIPV